MLKFLVLSLLLLNCAFATRRNEYFEEDELDEYPSENRYKFSDYDDAELSTSNGEVVDGIEREFPEPPMRDMNIDDEANDAITRAQTTTCLFAHNKLRQLHRNTRNLVLDSNLMRSSRRWAEHLASRNAFYHSAGVHKYEYGENLYYASKPDNEKASCAEAALAWYGEIKDYNFNNGKPKSNAEGTVLHFTQMVWRSTTKVGFGIATRKMRNGLLKTVIVARYTPMGNMGRPSAYRKNIGYRKRGAKTPTLAQLDPSTIPPCKDTDSLRRCKWLANSQSYGPCTNAKWKGWYFEKKCRKFCGFC